MMEFKNVSQGCSLVLPAGGPEDEPLMTLWGGATATMSLRLQQQLAPMDSVASQSYLQGLVDMARHVNNVLAHQGLISVEDRGTLDCELARPMSGQEWDARGSQ